MHAKTNSPAAAAVVADPFADIPAASPAVAAPKPTERRTEEKRYDSDGQRIRTDRQYLYLRGQMARKRAPIYATDAEGVLMLDDKGSPKISGWADHAAAFVDPVYFKTAAARIDRVDTWPPLDKDSRDESEVDAVAQLRADWEAGNVDAILTAREIADAEAAKVTADSGNEEYPGGEPKTPGEIAPAEGKVTTRPRRSRAKKDA
jgi:hypothetical protein